MKQLLNSHILKIDIGRRGCLDSGGTQISHLWFGIVPTNIVYNKI